jgi:hypothetical protein
MIMKVGKYEIITLEFFFFDHAVKMTQKYHTQFDMGHYSYVVYKTNNTKDIIDAGDSTCSGLDCKIDQEHARELYERAVAGWEKFVKAHSEV